MKVSIIIVSFNSRDLTLACILSIKKNYSDFLQKKQLEIVVVDNDSKDTTVKDINLLMPQSQLSTIKNTYNLGFAKACNIGAKNAKGEFLFFLNSDTTAKDSNLFRVIEFMESHSEVGVVGVKLVSTTGKIESSAEKFYHLPQLFSLLFLNAFNKRVLAENEKASRVDWVNGAAFIIYKKLFESLGGFDEKLFMYVEDMELCYRVTQKGKQIYFVPFTTFVHIGRGSSNRTFAITSIYSGILYFYQKHRSKIEYNIARLMLITKASILILAGFITNNSYIRSTYVSAFKKCL